MDTAGAMRLVADEATADADRDPLDAAVDGLVGVRADELTDDQIVARLERVERVSRRLDAYRGDLASTLSRRRERRPLDGDRAGVVRPVRARRDTERELSDRLGVRQGEVRKAIDTARAAQHASAVQAAFARGEIGQEHVRIATGVLRHLSGDLRRHAEHTLLEAAGRQGPREFVRTARELLTELDPHAAAAEEDRRHANRRAALSETDDGSTQLYGRWGVVDGAIIARAVRAFRRPDRPGQCRTPEQATADAIVDVCRAALDGRRAPTDHGTRPHVVVTVPLHTLTAGDGAGPVDLDGTPVALDQVRQLLDDAGWSFVLTDHKELPVAVTDEVRTVPAGLRRALAIRDRGCIRDGCDRPVEWCDVMHLDTPYAKGGKLTLATAALGCRSDHRDYDNGRLQLHWNHGRPVLRPPPRGPTAAPRDGPSP